MSDFLLELRCEEIPARMQAKARGDLEKLFAAQIGEAGLKAGSIKVYSTPRRLALIASGLPEATEAVSEERKGPKADAPEKALEGFLRSTGLTRDQLVEREVKGNKVLFAIIEKPGRKASEVLAEAIPAIIRAFPWPKSQRWGAASISTESLKWVRPLSGIIALFGDDVVPCEIDGIESGSATLGHRFHHQGEITIGNASDYAEKLRACHVIVDHEERQNIIRDGAAKAAADAGLSLIEDEGLVIENAGLTEWPVPLLGRFDESFLQVPPEVIQLTARVNQKYFVVNDGAGKLTNAFVCTANIAASDGGDAIVAGNEKVLAARLGDAKFFWELDQKTTLEQHSEKLKNIVFHERLGTVADKVERVAKLARWLCEEGIVKCDADMAEQAARLCKADLVTEMVGEFPELQGLMGGYYAEKQGLDPQIAETIRDHYKPVGQGDDVPTDPVTVAVSLADKLDTLTGFFAIGEPPTGSKDPYALRRAALGVCSQILASETRAPLYRIVDFALSPFIDGKSMTMDLFLGDAAAKIFEGKKAANALAARNSITNFLADRLKVQQKEAGVRHDLIDAVFALGGEDDLVRLLARVKALQAFVTTEEGANLLAGYKRAANILKQSGDVASDGAIVDDLADEDRALLSALDAAQPKASTAIEAEDFAGAMAALASLRAPIDAFFEGVMVNDPDEQKRAFRMNLLTRFRDAVHRVADFSKIEG